MQHYYANLKHPATRVVHLRFFSTDLSEELSAAAQKTTSASEQVADTLGQLASGATEQSISVGDTSESLALVIKDLDKFQN